MTEEQDLEKKRLEGILDTYYTRDNELDNKQKSIIDMHELLRLKTFEKHLKDGDTWKYERLDTPEVQEKVFSDLYHGYENLLHEYVNTHLAAEAGGPIKFKTESEKKKMIKFLWGVDKENLRQLVAQAKSGLTRDVYFKSIVEPHLKSFIQWEEAPGAHISPEDIPKLLEHIGASKYLDNLSMAANHRYMPHLIKLLDIYRKGKGEITADLIKGTSQQIPKEAIGLDSLLKGNYRE